MDLGPYVSGLATFVGGAIAVAVTRAMGITQRLSNLERRCDTQAELIAGLTEENRALRTHVAKQDEVIRKQARHIGELERAKREAERRAIHLDARNRALAEQLETLQLDMAASFTSGKSFPPPRSG